MKYALSAFAAMLLGFALVQAGAEKPSRPLTNKKVPLVHSSGQDAFRLGSHRTRDARGGTRTRDTSGEDPAKVAEEAGYRNWLESHRRLTNHPIPDIAQNGFKFDPALVGTWVTFRMIDYKARNAFGVDRIMFTLGADGNGRTDYIPITLRKNNQLQEDPSKRTQFPMSWGIIDLATDDGRPITMLMVGFEDGSFIRSYYFYSTDKGDKSVILIPFDEEQQTASSTRDIYSTEADYKRNWAKDQEKLRVSLVNLYKARQEYENQAALQQAMMNNMTSTWLFNNTSNVMYCGMITC